MYLFSQTRLSHWNAIKCNIKEEFNRNGSLTISYNIMKYQKKNAGINCKYMDIYHTKEQTENISRSCSDLLLKTVFYFISQCTLEPSLESGLCKLDKELDNCNFTFI